MIQSISAVETDSSAARSSPIFGDPPVELVRSQSRRILASSSFSRSERLSRFLRFIVEETIAGRRRELKEYTIGTQVYARGSSFDPTTDTIVRVEARRLRATLQRYYARDGRSDLVWIDVPKGGYEPVFCWKASLPAEPEPTAGLPSIAVLPFENFGADTNQNGFCDGITDEIIHALAQVEGLRVAARTSAYAFKGCHQDVRSIGEALHVSTILEGSVRMEGDQLRITAQLVNIGDGYHLWSHRFDHEMKGAFAIQDEIARTVADVLRLRLGGWQKSELSEVPDQELGARRKQRSSRI